MRTASEVVREWAAAFHRHDARAAAALYHEDATNHQLAAGEPAVGRAAILANFEDFFRAFPDSYTRIDNVFGEGEWAVLEWSGGGTWNGEYSGAQPNGRPFVLRGCGVFHVVDGLIKLQHGYWDKATWFRQLGIPVL
jgi:steroid delta-isomerase-like uncharacterized protein